jgi:hypothetical protein
VLQAISATFRNISGTMLRLSLLGFLCACAWAQLPPDEAGLVHLFVANNAGVSASIFSSKVGTAGVPIAFRDGKGMFLAHRWIEVQTSSGPVTLGFGSALLPFVDRGQITVQESSGRVEHEYALHFVPPLTFGRAPGTGKNIAKTVYVSQARADQIVEQQRHRKFIFPYIPFLHDCRTYVCAMQATVEGKSKLPCYVLLKGYW